MDSENKNAWRLRTQLVFAFAGIVSLVVAITAAYFVRRQTNEMREEIVSRRAALSQELQKRGTAIARNMALSSERAVATLDFLFLTEIVDTTMKNDGEFVYAISDKAITAHRVTDLGKVAEQVLPGYTPNDYWWWW